MNLEYTEVRASSNGQPKYEKRIQNDTTSAYSSKTTHPMRQEDVREREKFI